MQGEIAVLHDTNVFGLSTWRKNTLDHFEQKGEFHDVPKCIIHCYCCVLAAFSNSSIKGRRKKKQEETGEAQETQAAPHEGLSTRQGPETEQKTACPQW